MARHILNLGRLFVIETAKYEAGKTQLEPRGCRKA